MKDASAIIDLALASKEWNPDPEQVAFAGLSYGAGIALLAAAYDSRIKAVVSLSGWVSARSAFFENGVPNRIWMEILLGTGITTGRIPATFSRMVKELEKGNWSHCKDYINARGITTNEVAWKSLNEREVPLLLSNNFDDALFFADDDLHMQEVYKGPLKVLVNQGLHGAAEEGGLQKQLPWQSLRGNFVWSQARSFLDHWLRGRDNGIMEDKLLMEPSNRLPFFFWEGYQRLAAWPDAEGVEVVTFSATPRGPGLHGGLQPAESDGPKEEAAITEESVHFSHLPGIGAGIPVISDALRSSHINIPNILPWASRRYNLWYYTALPEKSRYCGIPTVSLDITPNADKWQVVVYVFSVNPLYMGSLVTRASVACWNCTAGERVQRSIDLRALCVDLGGVGHGLALAVNLFSGFYGAATTSEDFSVAFHYSPSFMLSMPRIRPGQLPAASAVIV